MSYKLKRCVTEYPTPQHGVSVQHAPSGPQGVVVSPMVWAEIIESIRAVQHQVALIHMAFKDLSAVLRDMALSNVGQQQIVQHVPQRSVRRGTSSVEIHNKTYRSSQQSQKSER
jgi:hypothetical protein